MESCVIRKATLQDFAEIHRMMEVFAAFQQTPEKFTITLSELEADAEMFNCYLAVVDGKIAGLTTWFFAYYSWLGKSLYIDDLFVLEEYRGMGIGNKLFDALIEIAKKANCKKLRWQVSKWNSKAIDFYEKHGAIIDDIEINCDLLFQEQFKPN